MLTLPEKAFLQKREIEHGHPVLSPEEWRQKGFHKKKKIKCPECGRKVLSMIYVDYMDEFTRLIPPHKKKAWWKKKNK